MEPYALKADEGWIYRYGIDMTVKLGELHPGRGAAVTEYTTRKGEEPSLPRLAALCKNDLDANRLGECTHIFMPAVCRDDMTFSLSCSLT